MVDIPSVAEEDTSFAVDTSAVEDKVDIPRCTCTVEVDIQAAEVQAHTDVFLWVANHVPLEIYPEHPTYRRSCAPRTFFPLSRSEPPSACGSSVT